MKRLQGFKDFRIETLVIPSDPRSGSGSIQINELELALNMDAENQRSRVRMGGWRKLLSDTPYGYNNQDLHDQMVGCQFYYQSFTEIVHTMAGVIDYTYPYFIPGSQWPDTFVQTLNDFHAGDVYPQKWNDGTYDNATGYLDYGLFEYLTGTDVYRFNALTIGWPDNIFPVTADDAALLQADQTYYNGSDYYLYDYFYGVYTETIEGYTIGGYSYGDEIPVYGQASSYARTYCGDDLYYQAGCVEAITMLDEVVSESGNRKLIAGTKSRIYVNDERDGSWRILVDRLGGPYTEDNCGCNWRRFKSAQLGNIVLFTNGLDPVLSWVIEDGPYGCSFWSADYVTDLLLLNIDSARVVAQWNGFAFIADTVELGRRNKHTLYWSDYNDPRSWAPGVESTAGSHEFGKDEQILAIEPIGSILRVYTSRAHYDATLIGGDLVFHFREVYRGPNTIWFQNSFVNVGTVHVYLGRDSIYTTDETNGEPRRVEWMHRAIAPVFNGVTAEQVDSFDGLSAFGPVNIDEMENVVGGYDPDRETVWFSWPTDQNRCANMSIVLNHLYGTSSLVDHGFTAFRSHTVDYVQSIRNWLANNGICDPMELLENKEGLPYYQNAPTSPPTYIRNYDEDPDADIHPDSVCSILGDTWLEDLCRDTGRDSRFVMASAEDFCLKEFTPDICNRERYAQAFYGYNCPDTVPGNYELDGYHSMMQWGDLDFNVEYEKMINKLAVEYKADEQTTPNNLNVQFGFGMQPGCMQWTTVRSEEMKCLTNLSDAQHKAAKSRPSLTAKFFTHRAGARLSWRIYVSGTGGGVRFDTVTASVRRKEGQW